ncbi:uncharacterized protein LOC124953263 isoform X1 [Vespa velutina]|uniref:uncharacterized protein LOC124953263 isoform X1 n=1 Tax=Vespa velutina TaxID=202808 RepID=UPI001FB32F3E|nr:uncharacterized protein LOC124953263 isoform X1 [Vespa velutina]XP_047360334.1 uncharacterized protein LOC124953263 isoform X1 [Vespa velutina]
MDHYLTTYQKDYTWPYPMKEKSKLADDIFLIGPCTCGIDPKDLKVPKVYGEKYDWSRVGPMGPLLDPKLYPAKTGPSPETDQTRFGQPDVYLKKLEEKYPDLYGVIQDQPTQETIMEVEKDRMMTTYMTDYGQGKSLNGSRVKTDDPQVHQPTEKIIKYDCRPKVRPPLRKFRSILDQNGKNGIYGNRKRSKKSNDVEGSEVRIPPWKSEYQDTISKVGHSIMKYKLHKPEKLTLTTSTVYK